MDDLYDNLWRPLFLSCLIALCATAALCMTALPLAFVMARRKFRGKSIFEALLTIPLVLPPTVVGFLLLRAMNQSHWPMSWFWEKYQYRMSLTIEAAVLAGVVVAFPILYLPAKAAFQTVDRELEDVAKLFGASRLQMFRHVSLPMARRGIIAGLVLAFTRVLGEFGATMMVLGMMPDKQTLSMVIYFHREQGNGEAWPAIVALLAISLVMMLAYNKWIFSKREM